MLLTKCEQVVTKKSGEGGIRTLGTGNTPYDGLANRCLKPLGHLSSHLLLPATYYCTTVRTTGGDKALRDLPVFFCRTVPAVAALPDLF